MVYKPSGSSFVTKGLYTMDDKQYTMKTVIIKGRPDYRARTPEQIKEFEDEFREKHNVKRNRKKH